MQNIPAIGEKLTQEHFDFLKAFSKSARKTAIEMLARAQSGHSGGSMSSMDYLTLLYTFILSQTGESIVVSNGHISPGVYGVLAEMGYIPRQEVVDNFRKVGSIYEGHITRHVQGVEYGTGPLGIGVSVGTGFAMAKKFQKSDEKIFVIMGDGEAQEGQVYEMMHFARKYKLDNLILFIDYNEVQLTDSLENIMPIELRKIFESADWHVIDVDGHSYEEMWNALFEASEIKEKPTVLIGHTIMGKGIPLMEPDGRAHKATWHGKAPKPEQADEILEQLHLTDEEKERINQWKPLIKWTPEKPKCTESLGKLDINTGEPIIYDTETLTDCRSAYGKALLDLAKHNRNIIAICADIRGSVMTKFVAEELPEQHIEVGIAEQHMISMAGGLSLKGIIPFVSTFGVFMTSRAKDQARVNDINRTNVKMVATHCGLSVGEDGPTHQAIDDKGSFLGLFNTMIIEPADPNQTDRIIRYVASHYGNFYVRMGRHKFPVITKKDGSIFYDADYEYEYGKCDLIRVGTDITIAATGASITEALKARESLGSLAEKIEIIAVSSMKRFDQTLFNSLKKTKNFIIVEDHNPYNGLASQLAKICLEQKIELQNFKSIGVEVYQLSGKPLELYSEAGISAENIEKTCLSFLTTPLIIPDSPSCHS